MKLTFNKEKNIGRVLFVVEGQKTEFWLLHRIFTGILGYQYEYKNRMGKHSKPLGKEGILSSVFVVNTEQSAIKFVDDNNEFLNNLFLELVNDYNFPVDRATIYYIFDRDVKSNTDQTFIEGLINRLGNSRDNDTYRQGLLLLSYPAVEGFVLSNFISNSFHLQFETGNDVKTYLNSNKIYQHNINEVTLCKAVEEMEKAFIYAGLSGYDVDNFAPFNQAVFRYQEQTYNSCNKYNILSLLAIVLFDLGIMEIENE